MAVAGLVFTGVAYVAYAWTALVRIGGLDDGVRFGVGAVVLGLFWLAAQWKPQLSTLLLLACLPLFGNHPGGRYMEFINLPLSASAGGLMAMARRQGYAPPGGVIWAFSHATIVAALVALIPTLPKISVRAHQINDPLLAVAAALTAAEDDVLYSVCSVVLLMLAVLWAYAVCWAKITTKLSRSSLRVLTVGLFATTATGVLDLSGVTSIGPTYLRAVDPRAVHLVGLQSVFWHPAWFAWYFVIALALALGWCAVERGPLRWLLRCGLALAYGSFFLNPQRGGLVTVHAMLGLFAWQRFRGAALVRASPWMIAGLVSIVILAVAALIVPDSRDTLRRWRLISIERIVDTAAAMFEPDGKGQRPLSERSRLWRIAVQMWLAAPAFGVGEGSFAWRFHDFAPMGSSLDTPSYGDAHNQFLQVLATRGTLGAVVFVGLLIAMARTLHQRWRNPQTSSEVTGLILALLAFVTYSVVSAPFYLQPIQILFWLIVALTANAAAQPSVRRSHRGIVMVGLLCVFVQSLMTLPAFAETAVIRAREPRGFYPLEYGPDGTPMRWSSASGVLCLEPGAGRVQLRFAVVDLRVAALPRLVRLELNSVDLDGFVISTAGVVTRVVSLAGAPGSARTGSRFVDCTPDSVLLRVSVDRTWSPADAGFGSDPRRLGVLVFAPTYLPALRSPL
jgi:hypothetical protein